MEGNKKNKPRFSLPHHPDSDGSLMLQKYKSIVEKIITKCNKIITAEHALQFFPGQEIQSHKQGHFNIMLDRIKDRMTLSLNQKMNKCIDKMDFGPLDQQIWKSTYAKNIKQAQFQEEFEFFSQLNRNVIQKMAQISKQLEQHEEAFSNQ